MWFFLNNFCKSLESKSTAADNLPESPSNRDILAAIMELKHSQSLFDGAIAKFEVMETHIDRLEKENPNLK